MVCDLRQSPGPSWLETKKNSDYRQLIQQSPTHNQQMQQRSIA